MRTLFIFCAICCFAAVLNFPIGYYTFLRIIVSLGAILMIGNSIKYKSHIWAIVFVVILTLFNPVFPIYLYRKSIWVPLDITVGILFLFQAFLRDKKIIKEERNKPIKAKEKIYTRDRIISSKLLTRKDN